MAEAQYSTVAKPWLKLRAALDALQQGGRHRLVGHGMTGEALQHLGAHQPVLVDLAGELDEVARHAGARDRRVGHVRQHRVQRVAELVEQRAGVVHRQQVGLARPALGEIHDVEDDGPDVLVHALLAAETCVPGPAALGRPREIIAQKQGEVLAVASPHVEGAHVGLVEVKVAPLGEAQPEQAVRHVESRRDDVVEREILAHLGVVEVVALATQLLGVEAPVVAGEIEVAALRRHHGAQVALLRRGAGEGRRPHRVEQRAHGGRRLGHGVVELVGGEAREAEQRGAFGPQRHGFGHDRGIVVRAATRAPADPSAVCLVAQVAPAGELQERHHQRARQGDGMPTRVAAFGGRLGGGVTHALRQPGEVVLALEHELVAALVGEHVLAEGGAEHGKALDDGTEPVLVRRREPGPAADEVLDREVEYASLFGVERLGRARGPHGLDPREQPRIHRDRLVVPGEQWRHGALDLLHGRAGMGARQDPEHAPRARQQLARAFEGHDRVGEARRRGIGHDSGDLRPMLGHAALEGGHEMRGSDGAERREAERRRPGHEERVVGGFGHGSSGQGGAARGRRGPEQERRRLARRGASARPRAALLTPVRSML